MLVLLPSKAKRNARIKVSGREWNDGAYHKSSSKRRTLRISIRTVGVGFKSVVAMVEESCVLFCADLEMFIGVLG